MSGPFFIVGPTAVGKTGVAVAVAELFGAEILSADAFQVYRGLDLLSAKPSPEERRRVPHHLVDAVSLAADYNVARFEQESRLLLDDLARRQTPALVVGGSGMYVKALTHGLSPLPAAQPALRAELDSLDLDTLQRRLAALDPATARVIDLKNKRRLVRAVEVCETTGRPFSEFRQPWAAPQAMPAPVGVLLVRDKADLDIRIQRRVEGMFARGVVDEVRAVPVADVGPTAARIIGWREVQALLGGEDDLAACQQKITAATRQYAKRQMTWFRKEAVFEKVFIDADESEPDVTARVCEHLRRHLARA